MRVLKLVSFPFRALFALPKMVYAGLVVLSLIFNVATLTVSSVYAAASSALSAVGVSTVAAREIAQNRARQKSVRRIGRDTARRATRRVQVAAARNISLSAGEALPFFGVAIIAGALSMEVNDACNTAKDMAGLEAALTADSDPEAARKVAMEKFDCVAMIQEELPGYEDLPTGDQIWQSAKSAPGDAWALAQQKGIELSDYDWMGSASRHWNSFMSTIERSINWLLGD